MTLTLIGNPKASCTVKVLLTLAEKGITNYNFNSVDLGKGEQKLPAYLAKQPFGEVPVLEDGDFSLYESRAICRYIAKKYENQGTRLLPDLADLQSMARFEQWANVEINNFDALVRPLQTRRLFHPLGGKAMNDYFIADAVETLDRKLTVFETAILSKQAFMAGSEFSLVDIFYMPLMAYIFTLGYGDLVNKRPLLAAWWQRVSARPSWKEFGVNAQIQTATPPSGA